MPAKTHLFLLGGSAAYQACADEFVTAAGGDRARIAVLTQTRAGWIKYGSEITQPWLDRGVSDWVPLTPDDTNGVLDSKSALAALNAATGIFIGGGHTPTYHRLFVSDPIGPAIREKYQAGIPVAGVSAGALICLEICQLTRDETGAESLQIVQGLRLASGFVVGVHFSERNALPAVLSVMCRTRTQVGFGIDESACILCENGRFARTLGQSVFRIKVNDFKKPSYQMAPL